jgi:hypothetical protein
MHVHIFALAQTLQNQSKQKGSGKIGQKLGLRRTALIRGFNYLKNTIKTSTFRTKAIRSF